MSVTGIGEATEAGLGYVSSCGKMVQGSVAADEATIGVQVCAERTEAGA